MTKLYVIMASQGEYSDRDEWAVCYYDNEELAKKHVFLAGQKEREIESEYNLRYDRWTAVVRRANDSLPKGQPHERFSELLSRRDKIIEESGCKNPHEVRKDIQNPYLCDDDHDERPDIISFYYATLDKGPIVEV